MVYTKVLKIIEVIIADFHKKSFKYNNNNNNSSSNNYYIKAKINEKRKFCHKTTNK